MTLIVSSILLLAFFVYIAITEKKCGDRSKDFFKRADETTAKLYADVSARYRMKYGKDPTLKLPAINGRR